MNSLKMKLVTVIVVLFAAIGLYAQCPNGRTLYTQSLTINGCDYTVDFCVTCPYGPFPLQASIQSITKIDQTCTQTLDFQDVLDAIETQVFNPEVLETYCITGIPPCDTTTIYSIEISYPMCWRSLYTTYMGNPATKCEPCIENEACIESFDICYNVSTKTYIKSNFMYSMTGPAPCTLECWEVDEPTSISPEPTECYIVHTACNP